MFTCTLPVSGIPLSICLRCHEENNMTQRKENSNHPNLLT